MSSDMPCFCVLGENHSRTMERLPEGKREGMREAYMSVWFLSDTKGTFFATLRYHGTTQIMEQRDEKP